MKARYVLLMIASFVSMQYVYGYSGLASKRSPLEIVNKNERSDFSEQELRAITSQLDVLFRAPVTPTQEWNTKVSRLLDRLPYSKYNRMYNFVMSTTYKKAINQKFQGYVAKQNNVQ